MSNQVIPVGYRLTIESWENDGDNYKTEVLEGLTKTTTTFLVGLAKLFYSQNGSPKGFGNIYEDDQEICELKEAVLEYVRANFSTSIQMEYLQCLLDDGGVLATNDDDLMDGVLEIVYDLGLSGCSEFYARVLDSYKVQYVPQEIVLNDVTDNF